MSKIIFEKITVQLVCLSNPDKKLASERYFSTDFRCLGANAGDIKQVISDFHRTNDKLSPDDVLMTVEYILAHSQFNEQKLVAFGLLNKLVKRHYDDTLLLRFEYWLEHYADNWSLVDDLCIKTIYQFLLARPHLITSTAHWVHSEVSWCRRASNVVWVKFIDRKIAKETFRLDQRLVFNHCDILIDDSDKFVQKSIGWLLKVTSVHHFDAVVKYIERNITVISNSTMSYAMEKMPLLTKQRLRSLKKSFKE